MRACLLRATIGGHSTSESCAPKEEAMQKLLLVTLTSVAAAVLVIASGAVGWTTASAAAGAIVDPSTLQAQPPNAVCRAEGRQILCDPFVDENAVNEPIFALPCGTIYETSHYHG